MTCPHGLVGGEVLLNRLQLLHRKRGRHPYTARPTNTIKCLQAFTTEPHICARHGRPKFRSELATKEGTPKSLLYIIYNIYWVGAGGLDLEVFFIAKSERQMAISVSTCINFRVAKPCENKSLHGRARMPCIFFRLGEPALFKVQKLLEFRGFRPNT